MPEAAACNIRRMRRRREGWARVLELGRAYDVAKAAYDEAYDRLHTARSGPERDEQFREWTKVEPALRAALCQAGDAIIQLAREAARLEGEEAQP